jgi:hypothetical protein
MKMETAADSVVVELFDSRNTEESAE